MDAQGDRGEVGLEEDKLEQMNHKHLNNPRQHGPPCDDIISIGALVLDVTDVPRRVSAALSRREDLSQ